MEFLDVRTDFAFKKVFGSEQSKPILLDFLNAVLNFDGERITDLKIVDPYQIPLVKGMKDSFVDVKAVLSNRTRVIIEMQVLNYSGMEKRVLYNAAKSYSTQLVRGEEYNTLEPIIALTITSDFIMFNDLPAYQSCWQVREERTGRLYNRDIELIFIELPKFTKTETELETISEKWIYFIQNAGSLEMIPDKFSEPNLVEAFHIANTAGMQIEELDEQRKRLDFIHAMKSSVQKSRAEGEAIGLEKGEAIGLEKGEAIGLEKGEAIGLEKGKALGKVEALLQTARNLQREGMTPAMIARITGLPEDEIHRLLLE